MGLQGKSLYVMTPCYGGQLTVNYHHSYNQLANLCARAGVNLEGNNIYNESLISRARNRMVDTYLKESSATHACFIDADIGFEATDILAMLEMDQDILGVPCTRKSIRWERIQTAIVRRFCEWMSTNPVPEGADPAQLAQRFKESGRAINPADLPRIGGDFVFNVPLDFQGCDDFLNHPQQMRHVGTGLLMIKREVFLKFKKAYPDRWYESKHEANGSNPGKIHDFFKVGINAETREYDSEDYWFIHDCLALNYKALLLPWVKTTHMGTYSFTGDMPAALGAAGTIF